MNTTKNANIKLNLKIIYKIIYKNLYIVNIIVIFHIFLFGIIINVK
jgi:hypothetical protein